MLNLSIKELRLTAKIKTLLATKVCYKSLSLNYNELLSLKDSEEW